MSLGKPRSAVFAFADGYIDQRAAIDPIRATTSGVPGYDHLLPSFSQDRWDEEATFTTGVLAELDVIDASDDVDRIAVDVMRERLGSSLEVVTSGEAARRFSVLWSPISEIRQVFELMAVDTEEGADVVAERLGAVPDAIRSWREGLEVLAARGELPSLRHVIGVADQAETYARGAFAGVASGAEGLARNGSALSAAGAAADDACASLAAWMRSTLAPRATELDASGPDRYAIWCRAYLGDAPALRDLYEWGWQDLRRINARMWELAELLAPGADSLLEVAERLDADDANCVFGVDEMLRRLEALTQTAIEQLDTRHFDIDERIRRCDVREAPAGSAAAPYYIEPSEDLSRPGTTWLPTLGMTRFPWWRHVSTWYHEGVPGHHLELAGSRVNDRLSRFQRLDGWTSGYGEGWALYAERLMEELGFFDDAAVELGYLTGQGLRAARIVVDLGLHLGFDAPPDLGELGGLGDCGGRPWTAQMAIALLDERALVEHEFSVSEVDRYLGNPAQAISYKVGERTWLDVRAAARSRLGGSFDLKAFHRHALGLGPMGLAGFEREMARWDGA